MRKRGNTKQIMSVFILVFTLIFLFSNFDLMSTQALSQSNFNDVEGHLDQEKIETWKSNGVIMGYRGEFRPDDFITVAELSSLLNRVVGYTKIKEEKISDIQEDAWYYKDVMGLYSSGVILAENGRLEPQKYVSKSVASAIFGRIFGDDTIQKSENFTQNKGEDFITRAQVISMLDNRISKYYNKKGQYRGEVDGNVVIRSTGVTLKDMKIHGNLYLMEGIGEGDVVLENVVVTGKAFVRGGGQNSVHIKGCEIKELICTKENVRVLLSNGTKISFLRSQISDGMIQLEDVKVEKITVISDGLNLMLGKKTVISNLKIEANLCNISGEKEALINELELNGQAQIRGETQIKKALVNKNGSIIEKMPKEIKVKEGVSILVENRKITRKNQHELQSTMRNEVSQSSNMSESDRSDNEESDDEGESGHTSEIIEERLSYHSVANKRNIPYFTEFEQIDLPMEATFTSNASNTVLVKLKWKKSDYNKSLIGEQMIKADVTAKVGELPSWSPKEIQITINVLAPALPKKMVIRKSSMVDELDEDIIYKNSFENYMIELYDENNKKMDQAEIKAIDGRFSAEYVPKIETLLKSDTHTFLRIEVPEEYDKEKFTLKIRFNHNLSFGNSIEKDFVIMVREHPNLILPPEDVAFLPGDAEEPGIFHIKFVEPENIEGIYRYEIALFDVQDEKEIVLPWWVSIPQNAGLTKEEKRVMESLPDKLFEDGKSYYVQVNSMDKKGILRTGARDMTNQILFVKDEEFEQMRYHGSEWSASAEENTAILRLIDFRYDYGDMGLFPREDYYYFEIWYDHKHYVSEYVKMYQGRVEEPVEFIFPSGLTVDFSDPDQFDVSFRRVHPIEQTQKNPLTYKYKYADSYGLMIEEIIVE